MFNTPIDRPSIVTMRRWPGGNSLNRQTTCLLAMGPRPPPVRLPLRRDEWINRLEPADEGDQVLDGVIDEPLPPLTRGKARVREAPGRRRDVLHVDRHHHLLSLEGDAAEPRRLLAEEGLRPPLLRALHVNQLRTQVGHHRA